MISTAGRNKNIRTAFILFLCAAAMFSFSNSIITAVFNNYLSDTFTITDFQRGILELPRELPGFLVVFISALFYLISTRRLASLANLIAAAGVCGLALSTPSYPVMLMWLFMFSVGQHMFLPLNPSIAMEFAMEGKAGQRLGQVTGAMNFAAITGSFIIFAGFRYMEFSFTLSFLIAAGGFLLSSLFIIAMPPDQSSGKKQRFVFRKEYSLFYWLNILYGTRKQIFLTFAPWVLVTVFNQPTQVVAIYLFIGGLIGIGFNPLLGKIIDMKGERFVLMGEAVILIFICLGYGFAATLLPPKAALVIASGCFIADQLLMSVSMARATYIRKIALKPEDVSSTLTMGVTIDHLFSILVALVSGYLWTRLGYQYVFILGALIALANLFSARRIRTVDKPRL